MIGSEKQIKWAESIKKEFDVKFDELLAANNGGNEQARKAIEKIKAIEYSKFWIDHRESTVGILLRSLARNTLRYKGLEHSDTMGIDNI